MNKITVIAIALSLAAALTSCTAALPADTSPDESSIRDSSVTDESLPDTDGTTEYIDVPSADDITGNVVDVLGGFHPGVMGYTIHLTEASYSLYDYASENDFSQMDPDELDSVLGTEFDKLDDTAKQSFVYNLESVNEIVEACVNGPSSNLAMFNDIDEFDQMTTLIARPEVYSSWTALYGSLSRVTSSTKVDFESLG